MIRRLLPPTVVLVASACFVGWTARYARGRFTLGLAGLLLAVAAAFAIPHWVLLAAFVGAAFQSRAPSLGGSISYADVLMVVGTLVALRRGGDRDACSDRTAGDPNGCADREDVGVELVATHVVAPLTRLGEMQFDRGNVSRRRIGEPLKGRLSDQSRDLVGGPVHQQDSR